MDGAHCLVKNVEQMKLLARGKGSERGREAGKEAVNTPLGRQLRRHHERRDDEAVLIAK